MLLPPVLRVTEYNCPSVVRATITSPAANGDAYAKHGKDSADAEPRFTTIASAGKSISPNKKNSRPKEDNSSRSQRRPQLSNRAAPLSKLDYYNDNDAPPTNKAPHQNSKLGFIAETAPLHSAYTKLKPPDLVTRPNHILLFVERRY